MGLVYLENQLHVRRGFAFLYMGRTRHPPKMRFPLVAPHKVLRYYLSEFSKGG